jgi:hypothetical protein
MVGEVPEGGLIGWGEHDGAKELLDLSRFRVLGVKREVQEDLFRGLGFFLGWCRLNKKLAAVLDVVLGVKEDRPQEGWRIATRDQVFVEETEFVTSSWAFLISL